ncbi:MAG: sulfatase [Verrucomicrobia bacterium]|nr:sulfatase [Verrucomicrobiota bacterium]MDA1064976.1 sulfatase [Verrucomicrobiota bacterium]
MFRYSRYRLASLILSCGLVCGFSLTAEEPEKPNFLVILVDDMGWTGLSGYGSDLHKTPHMDGLADGAMKFTSAYASASICTPTRAAMMTGKYPARLNMTIWHEATRTPPQNRKLIPPIVEGNLPHSEVTIAEVLQDAGYKTGHIGKWHLGEASHYPETQGFDFTFGGSFWGAPGTFYFPYRGFWGSGENRHPRYVPGIDASEPREGEHLTDRLTDEALGFIERSSGDPFFLYLAYYTVHTPIEGKPEIASRYENKIQSGMNHQNAHYAAMHETLDDNVGRLLQKLEDENIADHTVIILTSDNGGFINKYQDEVVTSNTPLRSGKGSLYEGGIRVPLIIRWPGVTKKSSQSDQLVHTADFYPTLLELAGLDGNEVHNKTVDGISLAPLLKRPTTTLERDTLYWHYPHYYQTTSPVSSIRQGKWKLLEFFEDKHLELYNLETDLGETQNLALEHPQLADDLREKLHHWRTEMEAQMPVANPDFAN